RPIVERKDRPDRTNVVSAPPSVPVIVTSATEPDGEFWRVIARPVTVSRPYLAATSAALTVTCQLAYGLFASGATEYGSGFDGRYTTGAACPSPPTFVSECPPCDEE